MTINAVLFDIGGVLLTLGEASYRLQLAQRLGLSTIPASYEAQAPYLQRGELAESLFWAEMAGRPVADTFCDDVWLAHFRPIPAMWQVAAELRSMGIRTGILSNTQTSHVRLMQGMGFLHEFAPVILSCEVGLRKPEPAIFRYALQRLALPAHQVAYVDDVPEYVAAATTLGLQTVLHTGDITATRTRLLQMVEAEG